jgi:hypothetical protein
VAARYDQNHVVFIVATDTESRFSPNPLLRSGSPTRIAAPVRPASPLAGLQELWEPDQQSLHFFPKIVQTTHVGDQWTLNVSPDATIPVAIERAIIAPTGCNLALGFLASVPADQQKAFAASSAEYFAVRRIPVAQADPQVQSHIGEIFGWKASAAFSRQIEQQLNDRMKAEVAAMDARLVANAGTPGAVAGESPVGYARPRMKEWLHADRALARGEGKLEYDVRAFTLTPDGVPRLIVRARWTLADATAFVMTVWFKADSQPTLLFADSSWSRAQREGSVSGSVGDRLDFQSLLNEFDSDHDGFAELLMHSFEATPQGTSSTMTLYLYTDKGLVPMKMPFRRDPETADSCLDP